MTLTSNSGGKMGVSTTGCGGGGCHAASSATSIFISFDGNSNLTSYTPSKKYSVQISMSNSSYSSNALAKAGFGLGFTKGSISNTPSGTMSMTGELHHTTPKALSSGSTTFSFDWTAPVVGSGAAVFNIAGNIVNGDGGTLGDAWDKTTKTLTEEVVPASKKATIASVISNSILPTSASISAQINANNSATVAEVQYGATTSYGTIKAMIPASISGSSATPASASLTGLIPNTTYNYRIKATNSQGDTFSTNSTFKTSNAGAAIFHTIAESISIYPNPASNYIIIKGENLRTNREISILSPLGKRLSLPIISSSAEELKANTSALSKGIYYILWNNNGKMESIPIVIEK